MMQSVNLKWVMNTKYGLLEVCAARRELRVASNNQLIGAIERETVKIAVSLSLQPKRE
jgi:hypothetical protein